MLCNAEQIYILFRHVTNGRRALEWGSIHVIQLPLPCPEISNSCIWIRICVYMKWHNGISSIIWRQRDSNQLESQPAPYVTKLICLSLDQINGPAESLNLACPIVIIVSYKERACAFVCERARACNKPTRASTNPHAGHI